MVQTLTELASENALRELVNGLSVGLGPLSVKLAALVRSLPSVYQLLPAYPCLDVGDGELKALEDAAVPDLESDRVLGCCIPETLTNRRPSWR
jgi:hypothetical protein